MFLIISLLIPFASLDLDALISLIASLTFNGTRSEPSKPWGHWGIEPPILSRIIGQARQARRLRGPHEPGGGRRDRPARGIAAVC